MRTIKKTVLLFTALLFAVTLGLGIFTACDPKDGLGDDTEYSVSVDYPDGKGASGVTVTFSIGEKEYESAKTDNNGTVKVTLRAGEYTITLSDLPEGYDYETGVTTNRSGTPLSISLIQRQTTYSATVSLPDGTKAEGVTVIWSKNDTVAGEAETDENGVASKQLPAGTYSVTVKNEPEGFWLESPLTATEQNFAISVNLQVDTRLLFTVTAETEGGMKMRNVSLFVLEGTKTVLETETNKEGTATFRLPESEYHLLTSTAAAGFTAMQSSYTLDKDNTEITVKFQSSVVTDQNVPASKKYVLGDIMYDFTVTRYDDPTTEITLSELLKTKKMVMLNFWYTTCTWCVREFPHLEEAYREFKDDIEVIAINPVNNAEAIATFRQQYSGQFQLTFPISLDEAKISDHFIIPGWPTSVFIDRYGAVARIEAGGIIYTEVWTTIFEGFISDNYRQTFTPGDEISEPEEFEPDIPDVEMPASSEIEAAINDASCNFTYYPEEGTNDAKYSWPFLVGEKDGKQVIKPANSGYRSSYSMIHSDMQLNAGDVVAFDCFSSCENTDILYVFIDNMLMWQIYGVSEKWETCYAYVALKAGTYKLSLLYRKDSTGNVGDDAVYVTNMRILKTDDIQPTTDIIRQCATDRNADGTAYENYVTPVKGDDGYYRVGKADGAYILADLIYGTNWNTKSIYQLYVEKAEQGQKFLYDLDGDGKKEDCTQLIVDYLGLATKSDIYGMVPVDETLKKLLEEITKEYSGTNHHEKEWLEVCKYFTRYGAQGGEVPFPLWGVNINTAIEIGTGEHTFQTNRIIFPVNSLVYKFVPEQDGVYYFHSLATEENFQTHAWLYTADGHEDGMIAYSGEDLLGTPDPDDGINFWIYADLKAGTPYYFECAFYWNDETTMGQTFDFTIEYIGAYKEVLTAAASGAFTTSGSDLSGSIILEHAIETVLYDGKYYYKNADGTRGSVIYIDVAQPTRANGLMTLKEITESYIDKEKTTHALDFTNQLDENGKPLPDKYRKDFTAKMQAIIKEAEAKTDAFDKRFVEATEELVLILTAYAKINLFGVENGWLQFAYYYHEYGAKPDESATPPETEALIPERQEETAN